MERARGEGSETGVHILRRYSILSPLFCQTRLPPHTVFCLPPCAHTSVLPLPPSSLPLPPTPSLLPPTPSHSFPPSLPLPHTFPPSLGSPLPPSLRSPSLPPSLRSLASACYRLHSLSCVMKDTCYLAYQRVSLRISVLACVSACYRRRSENSLVVSPSLSPLGPIPRPILQPRIPGRAVTWGCDPRPRCEPCTPV